MTNQLYHEALMEAARQATGHGRLAKADAAATVDNPLCGDRVTIELRLADGRIAEIAHEVRGCVLCKASAAVLAREAVGLDPARGRARAGKMGSPLARATHDGKPTFAPVRPVAPHRSRHCCGLPPFPALQR